MGLKLRGVSGHREGSCFRLQVTLVLVDISARSHRRRSGAARHNPESLSKPIVKLNEISGSAETRNGCPSLGHVLLSTDNNPLLRACTSRLQPRSLLRSTRILSRSSNFR